ncbi:MAG: Ig-like domain-containing protein [Proteobacteria bacterium]|nr:Ig-like domain-containing protein [Pseudomonadota bacterium]
MIYRITLLAYICISLLLANTSYAKQETTLFALNPAIVKSSTDAIIPISGSIKEWDIVFDANLVSKQTDTFEIVLPTEDNKIDDEIFSVVRTSYRKYATGSSQWAGDIFSNAGKTKAGFIIVNMINNQPFAVIGLNKSRYEIYYDANVGNRLAKIQGRPNVSDVVSIKTTKEYIESVPTMTSNNISGNSSSNSSINGTSVVDVLVLVDNDLNFVAISNKINAEKMNADLILSTSGLDGVGVPLILNLLPIETIDIPSHLEEVIWCPNNSPECPPSASDVFTDGSSVISIELINKRNSLNADILSLYVPFDPVAGDIEDPFFEVCGLATKPLNLEQDQQFDTSFNLLASNCGLTAFTFLHEIMHNFGSAHAIPRSAAAFKPHARGFNVTNTKPPFATLMGCTGPYIDPSIQDCDRIPQLSSPLVTINGQTIGNIVPGNPDNERNSDNVRFLTECNLPNDCRRDQLANRRAGSSPVDLMPTIAILTPIHDEVLQSTNSFTLTALASDDNDIVAVNWSVKSNGQEVFSGAGTGSNFSIVTDAFATVGEYIVTASIEDTIGQIAIDTNTIIVESNDNIVPVLYLLLF